MDFYNRLGVKSEKDTQVRTKPIFKDTNIITRDTENSSLGDTQNSAKPIDFTGQDLWGTPIIHQSFTRLILIFCRLGVSKDLLVLRTDTSSDEEHGHVSREFAANNNDNYFMLSSERKSENLIAREGEPFDFHGTKLVYIWFIIMISSYVLVKFYNEGIDYTGAVVKAYFSDLFES